MLLGGVARLLITEDLQTHKHIKQVTAVVSLLQKETSVHMFHREHGRVEECKQLTEDSE